MQKIVGKIFKDESVHLDFTHYEGCIFKNCDIHLEHGIFRLKDNEFDNCKLHFHGVASNIAKVIKVFYPDAFPIVSPLPSENLEDMK